MSHHKIVLLNPPALWACFEAEWVSHFCCHWEIFTELSERDKVHNDAVSDSEDQVVVRQEAPNWGNLKHRLS